MIMSGDSSIQLDLTGGSAGSLFAKLQQIQQNASMESARSSHGPRSTPSPGPEELSFDASKALQFDSIEHSGLVHDAQNCAIRKSGPTDERGPGAGDNSGAAIAVASSVISGDLSVEDNSVEDNSGDWFGYEQDAADKADFPQSPSDNHGLEVWERASEGSLERSEALIERSPIQPISSEPSPSATTSTKKAEILNTPSDYEKGVESDAESKHEHASPQVQYQSTPPQLQDQATSPLLDESPQVMDQSPPHSSSSLCLDLEVQKGYVKRMREKHEAREGSISAGFCMDRQQRQTSLPLTEREQQAQRDLDMEEMQALHSRAVSLEKKVYQQEHELKEKEIAEKKLRDELANQAEEIRRLKTLSCSQSSAQSLGWRVEGHSESSQEKIEGVDWKGVADSRGQQLAELRNVVSALEEMIVVERGRAEGLEEEVQIKTAQIEELERSIAPLQALRTTYTSLLDPSSWAEEWRGREGVLERQDSSGSWGVFNGGLSPITTPASAPPSTVPALALLAVNAPAARSRSASPTVDSLSPLPQAGHSCQGSRGRHHREWMVQESANKGGSAPPTMGQENAARHRGGGWEETLDKSKECVARICEYLDHLVGAAGASMDFRELLMQLSVLGEELKRRDHRLAALQAGACGSCGALQRRASSPIDREGDLSTPRTSTSTPRLNQHASMDASSVGAAQKGGAASSRPEQSSADKSGGGKTSTPVLGGSEPTKDKDRQIRRLEGRVQDLRDKMSSHRLKYTKKVTILLAALRDRESQLSSILEQAPFSKSGAAATQASSVAVLSGLRGHG